MSPSISHSRTTWPTRVALALLAALLATIVVPVAPAVAETHTPNHQEVAVVGANGRLDGNASHGDGGMGAGRAGTGAYVVRFGGFIGVPTVAPLSTEDVACGVVAGPQERRFAYMCRTSDGALTDTAALFVSTSTANELWVATTVVDGAPVVTEGYNEFGQVAVLSEGPGHQRIVFIGLPTDQRVATAIATPLADRATCAVVEVVRNEVSVLCSDVDGDPVDIGVSVVARTSGGRHVHADRPNDPSAYEAPQSRGVNGGRVRVERQSTGRYHVDMGGALERGGLAVSATTVGHRCVASEAAEGVFEVACRNHEGELADTEFWARHFGSPPPESPQNVTFRRVSATEFEIDWTIPESELTLRSFDADCEGPMGTDEASGPSLPLRMELRWEAEAPVRCLVRHSHLAGTAQRTVDFVEPAELPPPTASSNECTTGAGYWLVEADGDQYGFGAAAELVSEVPGNTAAVDIEATPAGCGTWTLFADGSLTSTGDAAPLPSFDVGVLDPGESLITMSPTPTGQGIWAFSDRGRVLTVGDAVPKAAPNGETDLTFLQINGPILDSVATPSGEGYIMLGSDGGVFSFGDAQFAGSVPGLGVVLNAPAVSLTPDPDGTGYWIVASDGGVFSFDAPFRGSAPGAIGAGNHLNSPIAGMVAYGDGYLQVATDGGVFNFSDQPFLGSLGENPPDTPIVAITPYHPTQV